VIHFVGDDQKVVRLRQLDQPLPPRQGQREPEGFWCVGMSVEQRRPLLR
jgi:hypothetical protein